MKEGEREKERERKRGMERERKIEWERGQKLGELERQRDRAHQRSLNLEREGHQARSPCRDNGPYNAHDHRDYNFQLGKERNFRSAHGSQREQPSDAPKVDVANSISLEHTFKRAGQTHRDKSLVVQARLHTNANSGQLPIPDSGMNTGRDYLSDRSPPDLVTPKYFTGTDKKYNISEKPTPAFPGGISNYNSTQNNSYTIIKSSQPTTDVYLFRDSCEPVKLGCHRKPTRLTSPGQKMTFDQLDRVNRAMAPKPTGKKIGTGNFSSPSQKFLVKGKPADQPRGLGPGFSMVSPSVRSPQNIFDE